MSQYRNRPLFPLFQVQCQVSLKRINRFMNSSELDPYAVSHNRDVPDVVHVSEGAFAWEKPPQVGGDEECY